MNRRVGFIGIGKLGMPCAEEIVKAGHTVYGYDVEKRTSDLVNVVSSIEDVVNNSEIIFIAVPTPHDPKYDGRAPTSHLPPKNFDYSIVKSVLKEVNKYATKSHLVVLISTVLPGTTRREFIDLIPNARFVYNPYLIAMGSVAWDMVNPEMVMIGTEDGSLTGDAKELIDFYKTVMQNDPRYEVGTWDEVESMKIFYNTWISAKVGLVNLIQDVAEKLGNINVDVVTQALARSTQRITGPKYMVAGMGDGGACHPRDNIALRWLAQEINLGYDLFDAIMDAREKQAKNMADALLKYNMPVVIVGKAYKPNVPYTEGSPSMLVGSFIEGKQDLYYLDPETGDYPPADLGPAVYLLAHNYDVTYFKQKAGSEKYEIDLHPAEGSVIVDPWRQQTDIKGCKIIHYGNTRRK